MITRCLVALACLVTAEAFGQRPSDPSALVEQLGADRYADREEAATALLGLGRTALPSLKQASGHSDPEVRKRSVDLLRQIEADLLVQPTMVRLDFRDMPLPDVVAAIAEQAGVPLILVPENNPIWRDRRIDLVDERPVPFWTMLERLTQAASLRENLTMTQRGGAVQLLLASPMGQFPVSHAGPFRSQLQGIHYRRDREFGPNAGAIRIGQPLQLRRGANGALVAVEEIEPGNEAQVQFYLDVLIEAEPRMWVQPTGEIMVVEATTDRGESLLIEGSNSNPDDLTRNRSTMRISSTGQPSFQTQIHLNYPKDDSRLIRRLNGRIPVTVAARRDEPQVLDLAQAKGASLQSDEMIVTVLDVSPSEEPRPGTQVELSIRPLGMPGDAGWAQNAMQWNVPRGAMPYQQFEFRDAEGGVYERWLPRSSHVTVDEMRLTLLILPQEGLGPPTQICYYGMTRADTEVHFDFRDVPMP